jgi:glycosyltransferase involved in cell wall biosynthesis
MRFSLVVATLGRSDELRALFDSLVAQTFKDFEVIVVDQNADDRLAWMDIFERYPFPLTHHRFEIRHVACARNVGWRATQGEIVGFPDDDCLYPPNLLAMVDAGFRNQPGLSFRTGPAVTPDGEFSSMRWQQLSGDISLENVWFSAIAFNIFMARNLIRGIGGFNEVMGVGGFVGSGEETDLVLRAIRTGARGWYDIGQQVIHPEKALTPAGVKRAFSYGVGCGYVLREHHFPARIWLPLMLRSAGGCLVSLLRGRLMHAKYYWHTLRGRIYGYIAFRNLKESSLAGSA